MAAAAALAAVIVTIPLAPPVRAATSAANLPAAVGLKAYVYSGTGYTFTEGDGTYTQHLLDGRVIWFFSDSFLGAAGPGGGRGPSGMLHNQIVVQDSPTASGASNFHNVWPNGWGTNSFAASGCAAEWPAASIQSTLNTVQVVLRCVDSSGTIVRLDLATLTINSGLTGWTVSIDTANFDSAARVQTPTCYPDTGNPCTLTTYGAKEQPAFESNGDIVFTYNVNVTGCSASDAETAYEANVANYDPVFMYG